MRSTTHSTEGKSATAAMSASVIPATATQAIDCSMPGMASVIGSYLGAFIAHAAGFTYVGFWPSLLVSALGAIVLLFILGLFRSRSTRFQ